MATDDFYGVDLRLSDDGDLLASPSGDLITVSGPANVAQALSMRLRTAPGELPMHATYGSTLMTKLIGSKGDVDLSRAIANSELRDAIRSDRRMISARGIETAIDPNRPGMLQIALRLKLSGGDELAVSDLASLTASTASVLDPTLQEADPDLLSSDLFLADDDVDAAELPDIEEILDDELAGAEIG